jgi:segregation and condensation protein A
MPLQPTPSTPTARSALISIADQQRADDEAFERGDYTPQEDFTVDVNGFEGPLDLLLELARRQKLDLAQISILALAEQYLAFIQNARKLRLDLAGDYLIMAAWLAYLKSRLILPQQGKPDEPDAANLAENLAEKLRYLEAIRKAARQILDRPQFGFDFFARGAPEALKTTKKPEYQASLYELLAAYAQKRQQNSLSRVRFKTRVVWSLKQARTALESLVGSISDWTDLDQYLVQWATTPEQARTIRASTFVASLEMTREGVIELHQKEAFAPLKIRRRAPLDSQPTVNAAE